MYFLLHRSANPDNRSPHKGYIIGGLLCTLAATLSASFWGAPNPLFGGILYWVYWSFWALCIYYLYNKASPVAQKLLIAAVLLTMALTAFKTFHTISQHMRTDKSCASVVYVGEWFNYPKFNMAFNGKSTHCVPDFPLRDSFNAFDRILNDFFGRPVLGAALIVVFLILPLFLLGKGFHRLEKRAKVKKTFLLLRYAQISSAADKYFKKLLLLLIPIPIFFMFYFMIRYADGSMRCPLDFLWGWAQWTTFYVFLPAAIFILPWFFKVKHTQKKPKDMGLIDKGLYYFAIISLVSLIFLLPDILQHMSSSHWPDENGCMR